MNKKSAILTRPLMLFMGAMILANIPGQMYYPLLPLYLQSLGAGVAQVGLFFTLSSIVPLAFQILGGWFSDHVGRLQAVALGSLAGLMGFVVYLLAPTWQWVLLASVANAISGSFIAPSYQAYIAEQSSQENYGKVYGILEGLFMVVGVIGPLLGGFISGRLGYRPMFITAAGMYFLATLLRLWMARGARAAEKLNRTAPTFANLKANLAAMAALVVGGGIVTWIMVSDGVRDISFATAMQFVPIYMQDLNGISNEQIGILSSMSALVVMLLIFPSGWLSDKLGERVTITMGFGAIAVAIAVFLVSHSFWQFAIMWVLVGLGQALVNPAYSSLISKVVPANLRGTAFGLFSTSLGVISLPAPLIGGLMWAKWGPQSPFYVPLIASVLLLPLIWFRFKLPKKQAEPIPGE